MVWSVQLLPLQVGPPSEYARSQKIPVAIIVTAQFLLCIVSILEFVDIFGGILLGFAVFFGYVCYLNNLNITYIVIWGIFSIVHFFYASIAASLIMIIDAVTFRFSTMITHAAVCIFSLLAANLSWRIYADFENEAPRPDLLGQFLIGVGVLHSPDEQAPLLGRDPNAMMAGMAAKNMGAQLTGGPQQTPAGMFQGLFGGPSATNVQAQGQHHAANAQAQGQAAQAQAQTGLAGLFGAFSPPATGDLQAQGHQHAAAAQAQGQAGLTGAQGWFTNAQQQVSSGDQLGGMRDPFGVATPPTATRNVAGPPTATAGATNIANDPFLTGSLPH